MGRKRLRRLEWKDPGEHKEGSIQCKHANSAARAPAPEETTTRS